MANATFSALLTATGTASQITITGSPLNPVYAIALNPILPGNGGFTMPVGTTLQRAGGIGTARFNTSLTQFECTVDGIAWIPLAVGGGGVASVSGTANRITSTGGINPVIDISAAYVGQTSITTLGTITTGVWNASLIPLAYGGTNANLVANNGGIFYSTATAGAILAGTATARQMLQSGASTTPAWSTTTWPATTTINRLLYSSAANVITDLATANDGVLVTSNTGVPSILAGSGTTAQILQSNAAAAPTWSTATYPSTTTINRLLYSSAANTIVDLATANDSVLITSGAGVPSISGTLPLAVQNTITSLTNVTMLGTLTLSGDPVLPLQAVTKEYADAISAGIDFKQATYAATTASLNATYLNGVAGIGATLINAGALAAFSVDGVSPPINSRILVKNQGSTFQNGIYTLTTVGDGIIAWVLTRATDYDSAAEIFPGTLVPVDNGTVNAITSWLQTATVVTVGTDPITFTQFTYGAGTVLSVSGTANRITSTGGQNPVIDISAAYVGQTSITTLGTIATGTWSATNIALNKGGTNASLVASNGGIFYSTATAGAILAGTATANQVLLSGSSTTPAWSTATYPSTTTINRLLYSSAANTITDLATANNGVLVTSATGVPSVLAGSGTTAQILQANAAAAPSWSTATYPVTTTISQILYSSAANTITGLATANRAVLTTSATGVPVVTALATDGQLIIGSTAGAPAAATLTAGAGIAITNASNSITITTSGGGLTWTTITGATQALVIANGYVTNRAGGVTYTLPASGTLGDVMRIIGKAGLTTIAQNANQQIVFGNQSTTVGVTGSLVGTNAGDCIELICQTAGASTVWVEASSTGNWTVT